MILIYSLIFRIVSGEPYRPATREDTKLWLALLASIPPIIGIVYYVAALSQNWSLFLIWLSVTVEGVLALVAWYLVMKLPGLKSVGAFALAGWGLAFLIAFDIL